MSHNGFRVCLALASSALCCAATVSRRPYLQDVRADSVTILWATAEESNGTVEYSPDGSTWHAVPAQVRPLPASAGRSTHQFQAVLKGLGAGREYFYRVVVEGRTVAEGLRFRTRNPNAFTFLVLGDSGTGGEIQKRLAERMISREDPALVLHVGDLSQEDGTLDQLDARHFDVYAPLMGRTPFFPTPGNHDYYTDRAAPYLAVHAQPASGVPDADTGRYYSFDWGNVHFVSLDSNLLDDPAASDRMLEWLDRDLTRQTRYWKIVYFHHPPYPTGHHIGDPLCLLARHKLVPVLERHLVDLVLNGHEHSYQRSLPLRNGAPVEAASGTVYVVTGGGGGVLQSIAPHPLVPVQKSEHHYLRVEVQGSRLTVAAVGMGGEQIDRFMLTPRPALARAAVSSTSSRASALAPGSLVTIQGWSLATHEARAVASPLPTELAGTSVTLNGVRLPLAFVSPSLINAQLPYVAPGPAALRVSSPNAWAEIPVVLAEVAPAILETPGSNGEMPAIIRVSDGSLVSAGSPVRAGEAVVIYALGLGPVDGEIAAGHAAPDSPPLRTRYPVEVRIGDVVAETWFAGLSPGMVGLYQVNAEIPAGLGEGIHLLRLMVNGTASEPVALQVDAAGRGAR